MVRTYLRGGVWKNTEDEILKAAIMKYGKTEWARVASLLPKKSAKQCKARWQEWLDPSIKKTEWTRQEDEKLLHLAKLMPTQWRTIAPMVGRTAMQCLQRYEQLLEAAAAGGSVYGGGDNNNNSSISNIKRLRPGEIDPAPETKPARPDAIDMDEDEKEMLSEAKARLANTTGRKAKRKAREKQLLEARRMAQLQKRRELKAAGIIKGDGKMRNKNRKKKKPGDHEINYNEEIPFLTPAPRGMHDTSNEDLHANNPQFKRMMAEKVIGKQKSQMQEEQRRKDRKKQAKHKASNLPDTVKRMSQLNDVTSNRKRSRLMLPPPMVTDEELELVSKLRKSNKNMNTNANTILGGGYNDDFDDNMSMMSGATSTLSSAISMRTSVMGGSGSGGNNNNNKRSLIQEARDLIARTNSQTPLMAAAQINRGIPLTDDNMSYQNNNNNNSNNNNNMMMDFDATSIRSNNNDPSGKKMAKLRAKKIQNELRAGFSKLPAPKFTFDVTPTAPSSSNNSVMGGNNNNNDDENKAMEVDRGEMEEQARKINAMIEEEKLEKRSQTIKNDLPRPIAFDNINKTQIFANDEDDNGNNKKDQIEQLVRAELINILQSENVMYPNVDGENDGNSASTTTSSLRKRKRTDVEEEKNNQNSNSFIKSRDAIKYINQAKQMVTDQYLIDYDGKTIDNAEDLNKIFDEIVKDNQKKEEETVAELSNELQELQNIINKQNKYIKKLKKKSTVYLKGYVNRSEKAFKAHADLVQVAYRLNEELEVNKYLQAVEANALPKRLNILRNEVNKLNEDVKKLYNEQLNGSSV